MEKTSPKRSIYKEPNVHEDTKIKRKLNVLVIAPHYRTVVKGNVESLARYVNKIYVMLPHNYLSEFARYLPFSYFKYIKEKYSKKKLVDLTNKPDNVKINIVSTLYFIPDGRNKSLGDKLFKKFDRFIQENNIEFDIIHAHFTWPFGYTGVKLAKRYNVPVIITAHGYDVYNLPFKSEFWFKRIRWTFEYSDYIITVSQSNKQIILEKFGIPEDKVSVIPNGINSNLFYPMDRYKVRKKLNLPLNKKIVLNVANLVPIKGHEYLIRAMKEVVKYRKDVLLIIVGGGPLEEKIQGDIKNLDLRDHIKLVGPKPYDEIPLWMNAADIFVLSSLNEGNPMVMFEALGVGLPFVGTKVGGVPEVITSEDYGLLCNPGDPKDLAEKILIAIEKQWDRDRIREYAEQFMWEKIAKNIINNYIEMLSKFESKVTYY